MEIIEDGIRLPRVDIQPERDMSLGYTTPEGQLVQMSDFRSTEDQDMVMARLNLHDPTTHERLHEEVLVPRKIDVIRGVTMHVLERRGTKVIIAGTLATAIAAGGGIMLKRFQQKKS